MSALAPAWFDDPDGEYQRVCLHAEQLLTIDVISAAECVYTKWRAAQCRDEAKRTEHR